jgi:hypothetical protein
MATEADLILIDQIEPLIVTVRNQNVLLDKHLAAMYGVETKRLNEQVRRNRDRFPEDFMFHLTEEEAESLRSQNATLKRGRGQHRKYRPYAFTEHGAIMAASVLNTPRAVEVSVFVVRAFVKLREFAIQHRELARKLTKLERKVGGHDDAIRQIVATIRELTNPPEPPRKRGKIGFGRRDEK